MGWHPSWFRCENCSLVYLEYHPVRCICGSWSFLELFSEDCIPNRGRQDHKHINSVGSAECDDCNGIDLTKACE
jgi:hypothetical protein